MKILIVLFLTLIIAGCGTTTTLTNSNIQRDTVLVFQPIPIHDTVVVEGQQPTGIFNKDCDTLAILSRYADFSQSYQDSMGIYRKTQWDAQHRKLTTDEVRPPEKIIIPVVYWSSSAVIKKRSITEWMGIAAIGASIWTGIILIGYAAIRIGLSKLPIGLP